jgi:hypothetical protein
MKKKEDGMPSNISSQKKSGKQANVSTANNNNETPEKNIEVTDNPGKTQRKIPNMK